MSDSYGPCGVFRAWGGTVIVLLACLPLVSSGRESQVPARIVIRLDASGRYDSADVARQFGRYLGRKQKVAAKRRKSTLSTSDRLALVLLDELGIADVTFEHHRITIEFHRAVRDLSGTQRALLTRWLHVPDDYWSGRYGLRLPENAKLGPRTIIVIHGLEADATMLESFIGACSSHGITAVPFVYPNDGPIAKSARHLSSELKKVKTRFPQIRLVIVAHSMGGLVARYCLEEPSLHPDNVSTLITLGTPHHGSSLASFHPLLELMSHASRGIESLRRIMKDGMGEAADELLPGSEFLVRLGKLRRPAGVRYYVAAGNCSFVGEAQRVGMLRELQREENPPGRLSGRVRDRLVRLLESPEVTRGQGDGVVSVKSALFRPNDGERVFPRNHMDLIRVRNTDDEVFQWIMDLLHWGPDSSGWPTYREQRR